jgi:hypothetical protein
MSSANPLLVLLPKLLPLAAQWVQSQEAEILAHGIPLTPSQQKDAKDAGVKISEKVRLQVVRDIPVPADPVLSKVARETGLLGPGTAGLTLRYGIYIRHGAQLDRELHVHEFVHVGQYERLGSIEAFLGLYLKECVDPGYPFGPMEQEAVLTARRIVAQT